MTIMKQSQKNHTNQQQKNDQDNISGENSKQFENTGVNNS